MKNVLKSKKVRKFITKQKKEYEHMIKNVSKKNRLSNQKLLTLKKKYNQNKSLKTNLILLKFQKKIYVDYYYLTLKKNNQKKYI